MYWDLQLGMNSECILIKNAYEMYFLTPNVLCDHNFGHEQFALTPLTRVHMVFGLFELLLLFMF
jgi:hypothetical protein